MKRKQNAGRLLGALLVALSSLVNASETKFVQYDESAMRQLKHTVAAASSAEVTKLAYQRLLITADAFLSRPEPSVMEKTFTPPSGNKHDYLSISRYWWPDPSKADGLPWFRKDGITNPSTQTDDVDRNRLGIMSNMVHKLSLAYFLSGQEKYASKAAKLLKVWFIEPTTKMNPNLNFAQSVPGNPNGRRSGILDGRLIPKYVLDAVHIISTSEHWDTEDTAAINMWLKDYLTWLTQSDLGQAGAKQSNNHGSWYFFQVAALAYYFNDQTLLTSTIERVKASFEYQFDEQGKQAHELARTRSFFYSCFNLDAITSIANMGNKINQSIWTYESENGASVNRALGFLLPAAMGGEWPYETKGIDPMDIAPLLARFNKYTRSDEYEAALRAIVNEFETSQVLTNKAFTNDALLKLALFEPQYFSSNSR